MTHDLKNDLIIIGNVVKTHGVRGGLSAHFYVEDYKNLKNYKKFYTENGQEIKIDFKSSPNYHITDDKSTSYVKSIIMINDVSDTNKAVNFIGTKICIAKNEIEIAENEILTSDLLGLEVYKHNDRNFKIGKVKDIHDFGAGTIVEIESKIEGFKILDMFNFNEETFPEINLLQGKIYLNSLTED